jgi:drug/metabolite transporter (DMT)-like permease
MPDTTPAAAAALHPPAAPAAPALGAVPTLSIRQVLPWLLFAALLALVGLYFVSTEEGATSLLAGNAVHEWVHDSRHLLGFPCH